MQILVRKTDNVVIGVYPDDSSVRIENDKIVTIKETFDQYNKTNVVLYKRVKIMPTSKLTLLYTYDGNFFYKIKT